MTRLVMLVGTLTLLTGGVSRTDRATLSRPLSPRPLAVLRADTVPGAEARTLDSLATVSCVQDVAERAGYIPRPPRRSVHLKRDVFEFARTISADSIEIVRASFRIDTDSVRVWENDGPSTRQNMEQGPTPMRFSAECRRARTHTLGR